MSDFNHDEDMMENNVNNEEFEAHYPCDRSFHNGGNAQRFSGIGYVKEPSGA